MQKPSSPRPIAKWLLASSSTLVLSAMSLQAQQAEWNVAGPATGDWNTAANWTPAGVPDETVPASIIAGVDNGGEAVISSAVPTVDAVYVGKDGTNTGTVTLQAGGSLTINGPAIYDEILKIGSDGGTGIFNQTGGTLTQTVLGARIGNYGGTGTYNMSGGTATINNLSVGSGPSGIGTVNQTAGAVSATNDFRVGTGDGQGVYNLSGGTLTTSDELSISRDGTVTSGIFNLSGTGTLTVAGRLRLGVGGATALFHQTGGTANINSYIPIGEGSANSTLTVDGGTLNMSGGDTRILVGAFDNSTGTFNMNGGTVNVGTVTLGDGGAAAGTINLNGGTLNVSGNIGQGASSSDQHINLNGGTIVAMHDEGNMIAAGNHLIVNVQAGGLHFNSNGFDTGIQANMSGVGGLVKTGNSQLKLGGTVAIQGNALINEGQLTIEGGGTFTFDINASGVNNKITGAGSLLLFGHLAFDLSDADPAGGTWTVIDNTGGVTYDVSFAGVTGFTQTAPGSGVWVNGKFTFDQSTGILTAVPEPTTVALLCVSIGFGLATVAHRRRRLS